MSLSPQTPGILAEVAAERDRQIVAGFTPEHDDKERQHQILRAAMSYLPHAYLALRGKPRPEGLPHPEWPWANSYWRPKPPRGLLIIVAALIVAELERLDRAAAREAENQHA